MQLKELTQYKPQILALAAANGVANIRVFGSVARGEGRKSSDLDLLATPLPGSGWNFFQFALQLEDLLGCKVDIVSDRAINRHIRDRILQDAKPLFYDT